MSDIKELFGIKEESEFHSILMKLMDGEKDIDLKTQIEKPRLFTVLTVYQDFIKDKNLSLSANLVQIFIKHFERYMISYKRESRKEIVEALHHLKASIENQQEPKSDEL